MSFSFFPPSGAYAYGGGPLEGPPPLYNPLYPPRRGYFWKRRRYPPFRRRIGDWTYHYKPAWWDGTSKTALWYYY